MRSHADTQEDRPAELAPPVCSRAPWRLTSVDVLPGFRLRVRFNDGTESTVEQLAEFLNSPSAGLFAESFSSGPDHPGCGHLAR
jgi:hypothetical protein